MKRTTNRVLSLLLACLLLLSLVPVPVQAAGEAAIQVSFYDGGNDQFLLGRTSMEVSPGLALSYGYSTPGLTANADHVTVFDALVQVHIDLLGEDLFTPEDCELFLQMTETGYITSVFMEPYPAFGFFVNQRTPNDGEYNENYGSYTGFTSDQAVLEGGDVLEFFFYKDTSYWSDTYSFFDLSNLTVYAGEEFTLTLSGFMTFFGSYTEDDIEAYTAAVVDASILSGTGLHDLAQTSLTTNEDGEVTLSFDSPGTYIISAVTDEYDPIVAPWCVVTVLEANHNQEAKDDVQTIYEYFSGLTTSSKRIVLLHTASESAYTGTTVDTIRYGTSEGAYTNVLTYIKDVAASLTGRDPSEITVTADTRALPGTIASGSPIAKTTMDSAGNITPLQSPSYTTPGLMSVYFAIQGASSQQGLTIYFAVEPLSTTPQEKVDLEASAITWDVIKGKNSSPDHITSKIGVLSGSTAGSLPGVSLFSDDQGVSLTWSLAYTGSLPADPGALSIADGEITFGTRPNSDEPDATYRLTATLQSKEDPNVTNAVSFDVTVPSFAGDDAPTSIASYLPAPGQFVNLDTYRNPELALNASGGMVTLGSFGGSIIYYYEDAITDDPNNPYGIDFIIYGNAFTSSDGSSASAASEPAAVMVSNDGLTWYELAGSMYYDPSTEHTIELTYTNPDPGFSAGALDVPWTDNSGNTGVVYQSSAYKQSYYPDPANYSQYNTGVTANSTYSSNSMTVSGQTRFDKKASPTYGYGDVHANLSPVTNKAANPYTSNHYKVFNGDGMDLSWAVNQDGTPVDVSQLEVHYVKLYNPTMDGGGSAGEVSPEIMGIRRAQPAREAVGKSGDLAALSINGTAISLEAGVYSYSLDVEEATSVQVTPTASSANANILVGDHYVTSGTSSPHMLIGDKLRVLVQEGEKEPVIYTVSFIDAGSAKTNADIDQITILPGDLQATATGDGSFAASIPYGTSAVRIRALPLNQAAAVSVDGEPLDAQLDWLGNTIIAVPAGGSATVSIQVVSEDGTQIQDCSLMISRASAPTVSEQTITVSFALIGDTKHDTPQAHTAFETWIAKTNVTVPAGASVKYLTDLMLINGSIPFTTDSTGTYISSINGLSEFDNGPNSGWLFTLNGKHSDVGYALQTLSRGDAIVWYYTDDYTKEAGTATDPSGNHASGSAEDNSSVPSLTDAIVLEVPAELADGRFASTVPLSEIEASVQQAGAEGISTIQILPVYDGAAASVSIDLTKDAIDPLTSAGLTAELSCALGTIALSPEALSEIGQYPGARITMQISSDEAGTMFSLLVDGAEIEVLHSPIFISLPYDEKNSAAGSTWGLAELQPDGSEIVIPKSYVDDGTACALVYGSANVQITNRPPSYSDLADGHWAMDAIGFVTARDLMIGTETGVFSPDFIVTRGTLVTILHRLEGMPAVTTEHLFADVDPLSWYGTAALWAYGQGITLGSGASDLFAPEDPITREQLVTMLYRYAAALLPELGEADSTVLSNCNDGSAVSLWAQPAMAWAAENQIIQGVPGGLLEPGKPATRAELAVILQRLIVYILAQ